MSGGWDDLLAEAQQCLQEETDVNAELGDEIKLDEHEHFTGRWRGVGPMQTKRGAVDVFFLWDTDGNQCFAFQHSRLVAEVEEQKPQVGDEVLILRGPTKTYEKDGEERSVYPYVLRVRKCDDPLPYPPAEPKKTGQLAADRDLPFLCRGGHDPQSARAADAAIA